MHALSHAAHAHARTHRRPGMIGKAGDAGREGRAGQPMGEGRGAQGRGREVEESGVQTYLRGEGKGLPEESSTPRPSLQNQITGVQGAHFVIARSGKALQIKSLDTARQVTQQSMAPLPAGSPHHSHVRTERLPQPARTPAFAVASTLFNSYLPQPALDSRLPQPALDSRLPQPAFDSYLPQPSKMAPCIPERQWEFAESAAFWRHRYEELNGRWEAAQLREVREREVGLGRVPLLEEQLAALQAVHAELSGQYSEKLEENREYYLRIQELQAALNRLQLSPPQQPQQPQPQPQQPQPQPQPQPTDSLKHSSAELQEQRTLTALLQRENEALRRQLEEAEPTVIHPNNLNGEASNLNGQTERARDSSMLRSQFFLDRSSDHRNDLEAHILRLNAELAAREDAYLQELREAGHSLEELGERLRTAGTEKEEEAARLQQRIVALESDLNKKDSQLRALRDELTVLEVCPSLLAASDKDEPFKREFQALRRALFEGQREKALLKQQLQAAEESSLERESVLQRRRQEAGELRRQLGELAGVVEQRGQLRESLSKRSAEIAEMREMLLEKEQSAGDFEVLTQENDRLRSLLLRKNEELSELAERLFAQEKRAREAAARGEELEGQARLINEALIRREQEADRLAERLEEAQGNAAEVELELERQRHINEEYEGMLRAGQRRLEAVQEELSGCLDWEQQYLALQERLEERECALEQLRQQEAALRSQNARVALQLRAREEELQEAALQEDQLRQLHIKSAKELADCEQRHDGLQTHSAQLQRDLSKHKKRTAELQREVRHHHKCQNIIEELREKLAKTQMMVISLNMRRSATAFTPTEPSPVFERRVIYELKQQNERLQQVAKQTVQGDDGRESVRSRLANFDRNLEQVIRSQHRQAHSLGHIDSPNEELERLRTLLIQMQAHADHASLQREEAAFYRNKNEELEQRVQTLLTINKQLKQSLETAIRKRDHSVAEFYQRELTAKDREIGGLKAQRETLGQRLRNYELNHSLKTDNFDSDWH